MHQKDPTDIGRSTAFMADRDITVEELSNILKRAETPAAEPTIAASAAVAGAIPAPTPGTLPILKRMVSGRYRSAPAGFQLEVRVDVDGKRPLNQLSGDFFQINGATTTYYGSFVVTAPTLAVTDATVTIRGEGQFTWTAAAPVVQVTIPRVPVVLPPSNASVQFFTTANAPSAKYDCPFDSPYFRTVAYERGRASDVSTPEFLSYNTADYPCGGPARMLSVQKAYAEAGVELQVLPEADLIDVSEAGTNAAWSDTELEASMQLHFDQFRDVPQWDVWEMVAQVHELGPSLLGIMFDYQDGHQRQGCAVFHAGLGGITNDKLRLQLFTYVHEMGHCFNLMHSWQKSLATPPGVDRPNALSWMNYPWKYPNGGESAFWNAFGFQFDDGELAHIRHGFRNDVIMGANAFGTGAGLQDLSKFNLPVRDRSDLQLEISAQHSVLLGEPVVLQMKLKTTNGQGKAVHGYLHPNSGMVKIAIQRPGGEFRLFEPILEHCVGGMRTQIRPDGPGIVDSAYIGYGKKGVYFDHGGLYKVRAIYYALDGAQIVSNIINLRVRNPISADDEHVADLLIGNEQGCLFALLGSDSKFLANGNKAFDEVLARYPNHPLSYYVRMIKGVNAGRNFKVVAPGQTKINLRKADLQMSATLLGDVEKAAPAVGMDAVTLRQVQSYLALAQTAAGNQVAAKETEKRKAAHPVR